MVNDKARSLASLAAGRYNERADSSKFIITFDDSSYDLGSWSKASGLGVSWEPCEYRSGSHPDIWHAPGIPKYSKISLQRAACADSQTVQRWLAVTQKEPKPLSAGIQLCNWADVPIVTWDLSECFPTSWKISDLDPMAANVVIETLELAHTGFLVDQRATKSVRAKPKGAA